MAAMLDGMVPWPEPIAQLYRARGYWKGLPIGHLFDASVRRHSQREAVIDGARRVTYRQLGRMVDRFAAHLALREISNGCRVIFQLPNSLEGVVAYFACLKIGAIPVTCLPAHRHTEIEHLARFTDAAAWLIPAEYRRFDYVKMADELRGSLPSMREIIVVNEGAVAGTTPFEDLLRDVADERVDASALARLAPSP